MGPRWIIPDGPNLHSLLASWSPYRLGSRAMWYGMLAARRIGVPGWLPRTERVELQHTQGVNWQAVGWKGQHPPVPVIYVGTPGPRQKAVIHLLDPSSGQCGVVVKTALQPLARAAIVREASVLAGLEEESCRIAPRLIYCDDSHGVATQRYVTGSSGSRKFLSEYQDLLRSLLLPDEYTTLVGHAVMWEDHPLWDYVTRSERRLLGSALSAQIDASRLPACWMHGDFAPWNIRNRSDQSPALIDWELAERGGLPLLDAFHFMHIQQFLFKRAETACFADLVPFAESIGISAELCRKLEIAYLTQSYFTCMEWGDSARAASLLNSLSKVMRERISSTVCGAEDRRLRLVTSRPANHRVARTELFSALVTQLNQAAMPYCILSGHEYNPDTRASDVDIMFRPSDLHAIPMLLSQCARSTGGTLVQTIQHETSASFFVLAKVQGKRVAHLAVDCYGDYRRDDRTWLLANNLLDRRHKPRDFYRPSIPDEFVYRLIKKILKQSLTSHQLKGLRNLFGRDAAACRERLAPFFAAATIAPLERGLIEQNLAWFEEQLPALAAELQRSRNVLSTHNRLLNWFWNSIRLAHRILRPTGMFVAMIGGDGDLRDELADRLLCSLAPAFRRTRKLAPAPLLRSLAHNVQIRMARICSTLVLETAEDLRQPFTRWFSPPDLILRLVGNDPSPRNRAAGCHRNVINLNANLSADQLAQQSNEAILSWMTERTSKRLAISQPASVPAIQPTTGAVRPEVECEFVGSD